jgi:hypothetical protein
MLCKCPLTFEQRDLPVTPKFTRPRCHPKSLSPCKHTKPQELAYRKSYCVFVMFCAETSASTLSGACPTSPLTSDSMARPINSNNGAGPHTNPAKIH